MRTDAVTLSRNADIAMYHAKSKGKNNYQYFSTNLTERHVEISVLEASIKSGLENKEFTLAYQPIINLNENKVESIEVLCRWKTDKTGDVPPDKFIPMIENKQIMFSVSEWIFIESIHEYKKWQKKGYLGTLSLNISPILIKSSAFISFIKALFQQQDLSPSKIVFDLSEFHLTHTMPEIEENIKFLSSLGFRWAIDDFGTSTSSIAKVKKMPIDFIKIDNVFVSELGKNSDNEEVIKALIELSRSLKLITIIEGVETKLQLDFLQSNGCYIFQGFHFSKPLDKNQIKTFLENYSK